MSFIKLALFQVRLYIKNTYFVKIKQKKTGKILQYVLQLFP